MKKTNWFPLASILVVGVVLSAFAAINYYGNFIGDGSQLTSLNGTQVTSGTVADARLTANVTLAGNSFNTANKLLQLDGSARVAGANQGVFTGVINSAGGTYTTTFGTFTSAAFLGGASDETGTGLVMGNNTPTIITPTIASFANATHTHQNAAGGGTLDAAAVASGTVATARLGSGSATGSTFLRGDQTWATPAGGGGNPTAGSNTLVTGSQVDLNNALTNIQSITMNSGGAIVSGGAPANDLYSITNPLAVNYAEEMRSNGSPVFGGFVVAPGYTNSGATASTLSVYDALKSSISLANGGANTVVHGTTPPTETAVVEADQILSDLTTANATTSRHGYLLKLDNVSTHFMNGQGAWGTPTGGGGAAVNVPVTYFVATNGSSANSGLSTNAPWDLATAGLNATNYNTFIVLPGTYSTLNFQGGVGNATFRSLYLWAADVYFTCSVSPVVTNITIDGFKHINGTQDGIRADGVGWVVEHCLFMTNQFNGIKANNAVCSNNVFYANLSCYNGATNDGIGGQFHGIYAESMGNILIDNVFMGNTNGYGIQLYPGATNVPIDGNFLFGNITYSNGGSLKAGCVIYGVDVGGANAGSGGVTGTNWVYQNTFLDGLWAKHGRLKVTNNIVLPNINDPTHPIANNGGGLTIDEDYNIGTNTLAAAHDIVTTFAGLGLVNYNNGLPWLTPGSAARGVALDSAHAGINFWGEPELKAVDMGAVRYDATLVTDTRVLWPVPVTGSEYWLRPLHSFGLGVMQFSQSPISTNATFKGDSFGTNAAYVDSRGLHITNNISSVEATNGQVTASGGITSGGTTVGFKGLVASGDETNAAGSRVAYLSDTLAGVPFTTVKTNYVINQYYTNVSGSMIMVVADANLAVAAVAGASSLDLMADQSGGNTFTLLNRSAMSTLITSIAMNYTNPMVGVLSNSAVYYFTNTSSGAGNSSAVVSGTGTLTTFGNVTAASGPPTGTAGGRLSGTYPNPTIATYSSSQLATDITDENGGGPVLFSTGDGGGLTKLSPLAITNLPPYSIPANNTGSSAAAVTPSYGQVVVQASVTNALALAPFPFVTNFILQASTPTSLTNITGMAANIIACGWITISNFTAAAFTNWCDTRWVPSGYGATNANATLGVNGCIVPAGKEIDIWVECRSQAFTNWTLRVTK